MKKIVVGLLITTLILSMLSVQAGTETITITMDPQETINIECNQSAWDPSAKLGENEATSATWGNLTNEGDVAVLVNISATNSTGWTLENTAGHNQFNLSWTTDGSAFTLITTDDQTFDANIPASGQSGNYTTFGLKLYMPTSTSTGDVQTSTITFTATAL